MTKKKLIKRIRLIQVNPVAEDTVYRIILVGRIHKGIMEMNFGYKRSSKSNSLVKNNCTHSMRGECKGGCNLENGKSY